MRSFELLRARSASPMIDTCAIVPFLACVYATIVSPLIVGPLALFDTSAPIQGAEPGTPNRIFWPVIAAVSVILTLRNRSRLATLNWPPHIICLLAYLALAGASGLWAFRPEISFTRYAQQVMVLTSLVLPSMLAVRTADLMRGMFLCCAFGAILNLFFVLGNSPIIVESLNGYPGYFLGKNYLGEFSIIPFLMALHEMRYPGLRRVFGIITVGIAALLLFLAKNSNWPCIYRSIARGTYVDDQKDSACLSCNHSIDDPALLCGVVQCIWI